jgi:hypothetical protein
VLGWLVCTGAEVVLARTLAAVRAASTGDSATAAVAWRSSL